MAQFPVEDPAGLYEAVNYLLSGPSGLGQNFAGFSSYETRYLTGNFRVPFSQTSPAALYVAPIALSNAEQLDNRTIKYTFAGAPLGSVPFSPGNGINVTGITPSTYNSLDLKDAGYSIYQIGVVECTTSYVIVRTASPITTPLGTYVSGGSVNFRSTENSIDSFNISTDCNARVTVTGGTDRVFVAAQLNQTISYEVLSGPANLSVYVRINRYRGSLNEDPVNPDYLFEKEATISQKIYTYPGLTGTGTLPELETIFTSVIDQPAPGYFWYILEVIFEYPATGGVDVQVTQDELGLRSLSAQVVKQ